MEFGPGKEFVQRCSRVTAIRLQLCLWQNAVLYGGIGLSLFHDLVPSHCWSHLRTVCCNASVCSLAARQTVPAAENWFSQGVVTVLCEPKESLDVDRS